MRGWEVWAVAPLYGPVSWSARPVGALVAALTDCPDLETLEHEIDAYEADLDAKVCKARETLDSLPAWNTGGREVQEHLISALAELAPRVAGALRA